MTCFRSFVPVVCCCCAADSVDTVIAGIPAGGNYFRIRAVDRETGRGIPMVRFTVDSASIDYYTDSAGVIAFDEAGLMGADVYFRVEGFGYQIPLNEHRERALVLHVRPGGTSEVELQRMLPGQRLYRITGLSPYRDSRLLGDAVPFRRSPLVSNVMGQDSVYIERYRDRLFWLWGDTFIPLSWQFDAHHEVTSATGPPPGDSFDPDVGVQFDYFTNDDGFPKKMVAPDDGGTMTWFDGLVNLSDAKGRERLFALYVQMRQLPLDENVPPEQIGHPVSMWWTDHYRADTIAIQRLGESGRSVEEYTARMAAAERRYTRVTRGVMEFRDDDEHFHVVAEFPLREVDELHIGSQPLRVRRNARDMIYFCGLFPNRRVTAEVESFTNIEAYESFTCLRPGTRFDNTEEQLDRKKDGSLRWSWKRQTSPIGPREQASLVEAGRIRPEERWIVFRDVKSDREVLTQHNSVRWNPHRHRYVGLFTEQSDTLTDCWYAEADSPTGPWVYMQHVISLNGYTFYNPCHYFYKDGGRRIYVEGTVTTWMGIGPRVPIPRYNYNQMMYRLDLRDPRLFLPVPVYELEIPHRYVTRNDVAVHELSDLRVPVFFAPDQLRDGTVPIYRHRDGQTIRLSSAKSDDAEVAFYALPESGAETWTLPLYEYRDAQRGTWKYSVDVQDENGLVRSPTPVCHVWENPSVVNSFDPVAVPHVSPLLVDPEP